jgi:hypothetical protein
MVKTVMTMDCPDCGAIVEIPFRMLSTDFRTVLQLGAPEHAVLGEATDTPRVAGRQIERMPDIDAKTGRCTGCGELPDEMTGDCECVLDWLAGSPVPAVPENAPRSVEGTNAGYIALRPAGTDRPTDPLDGMTDAEAAADDATWD